MVILFVFLLALACLALGFHGAIQERRLKTKDESIDYLRGENGRLSRLVADRTTKSGAFEAAAMQWRIVCEEKEAALSGMRKEMHKRDQTIHELRSKAR